jgi:hypothetical protein
MLCHLFLSEQDTAAIAEKAYAGGLKLQGHEIVII